VYESIFESTGINYLPGTGTTYQKAGCMKIIIIVARRAVTKYYPYPYRRKEYRVNLFALIGSPCCSISPPFPVQK